VLNKSKKIIKSAQLVFSSKGIAESSISDIANNAAVADSIIYHYFKNKEDLLFHALGERMIEVKKELDFHFKGILGPESKLGKMIWFHLYINDLTPKDALILKNLLLECRARKAFYVHQAYDALRAYTNYMRHILQEGIDKNAFKKDLNVRVMRDIIFGLLDEESLSCISSHEIEKSLPDFDSIMDLILGMIKNDGLSSEITPTEDDKKEIILKSALSVFSEKGYHAATISEIASKANVAEGTIYTYFKNKEELLFKLPQTYFCQLRSSLDDMFDIKSPLRRLRRFARYHFYSFLSHREFLKVFLLDIKLNQQFYKSDTYQMFHSYTSTLDSILNEGKEQGFFRGSINNRVFRNMFIGAFTHLATRWFILSKDTSTDVPQEIDDAIALMCEAVILKDSGEKSANTNVQALD
jgi:TetR/AcrR family transcriptional regulator, fatty acid metabolism regulator protein